jgi:hypothetical protein
MSCLKEDKTRICWGIHSVSNIRADSGGPKCKNDDCSRLCQWPFIDAREVLYLRISQRTAKTQYRKYETNIPRKGIVSVPISTFMYLWAIYVYSHNRSAYSAAGKYADRSWEYINRSQTHECGNWDWTPAQFLFREHINGIFRCSALL